MCIRDSIGAMHISTGDLFRHHERSATSLGDQIQGFMKKGDLVPDHITIAMLKDKIESLPDGKGYILDGFPRTLKQAMALDELLIEKKVNSLRVIEIRVPDELLVERITGRFSCATCGMVYHKKFKPTITAGVCDSCGGKEFSTRKDDTIETVQDRLRNYHAQTAPLLPHYKAQKLLDTVDGEVDIQEVRSQIRDVLAPEARR